MKLKEINNPSNYVIGKIKCYGGLNNETGKEKKYGFISTSTSNEDYFFHKDGLLSSSKDLNKNTEVIFIKEKTEKGKKAVQVQIFSETHYAVICNKLEEFNSLFDFNPRIPYSDIYPYFNVN
jgi:cold shock CspA family protein